MLFKTRQQATQFPVTLTPTELLEFSSKLDVLISNYILKSIPAYQYRRGELNYSDEAKANMEAVCEELIIKHTRVNHPTPLHVIAICFLLSTSYSKELKTL